MYKLIAVRKASELFCTKEGTSSPQNVIALGSRVLKEAETRYRVTEREALAIVWSFQKFRMYLEGRNVVVVTGHKALSFMWKAHLNNDRLLRWMLWLQQFSFTVKYCPGEKNNLPDFLSRLECDNRGDQEELRINICEDLEIDSKLNLKKIRELQTKDPEMKCILNFLEKDKSGDSEVDATLREDNNKIKLFNSVLLIRIKKH